MPAWLLMTSCCSHKRSGSRQRGRSAESTINRSHICKLTPPCHRKHAGHVRSNNALLWLVQSCCLKPVVRQIGASLLISFADNNIMATAWGLNCSSRVVSNSKSLSVCSKLQLGWLAFHLQVFACNYRTEDACLTRNRFLSETLCE